MPANSEKEPPQKHYVSRRSRSQKGVLVFLARDAEQHVMCYFNAHVPKSEEADEILRFIEFWNQQTGEPPQELVFDSQLTTYANLRRLDARRTGHPLSRAAPAHDLNATPSNLITRYAQRMLIENGIAQAIHFFHSDGLSSMVGLNVDLDLQLTLMASSLYRLFAQHLPENYRHATAKVLFDNLLDVTGRVDIEHHRVVVTLDKRVHNPDPVDCGLADKPTSMPWLEGKELVIAFA